MRFFFGVFSVLVGLATLGPGVVQADTAMKLVRSKQCLACHQIDSQRVGPAFSVIADRYGGLAQAQQYLADTMRTGSRGKWGAVPMPAQVQVSPEDALVIANWIMSLPGKD